MIEKFPDIYRLVNINPSPELIKSRSEGIDNFLKSFNTLAVIGAIRTLKGLADKEFDEMFRAKIREKDNTFGESGIANEIKVLVLISCLTLLEKKSNSDEAMLLSLLALTGLGNKRNDQLFEEFLKRCENHLGNKSLDIRSQLNPNFEGESKLTKVPDAYDPKDMAQKFSIVSAELNDFKISMDVLLDEVNILWWLIGNQSNQVRKPFTEIEPTFSCVLFGSELADLVRVLPGPYSYDSILKEGLARCKIAFDKKDAVVERALENSPVDYRSLFSEQFRNGINAYREKIKDLMLIHQSFVLFQDGGKEAWKHYFKALGDIKYLEAFTPLALTTQIYFEKMILKILVSK